MLQTCWFSSTSWCFAGLNLGLGIVQISYALCTVCPPSGQSMVKRSFLRQGFMLAQLDDNSGDQRHIIMPWTMVKNPRVGVSQSIFFVISSSTIIMYARAVLRWNFIGRFDWSNLLPVLMLFIRAILQFNFVGWFLGPLIGSSRWLSYSACCCVSSSAK